MFFKFNRFLAALVFIIFFVIPQEGYIWATEECEVIEVDNRKPLMRKTLTSQYLKYQLSTIPEEYPPRKRMGILGEVTARDLIEAKNWSGKRYVSITTMFGNMEGCKIIPYLRDNADRGIDDIFVVLRKDGWIDQRHNPIFHESKYDGQCNLKLKNTVTLCSQLSFQWLDGNLKKAYKRTQADLCYGNAGIIVKSCLACKTKFQENVTWLAKMLKSGNFRRTASLLCANGQLSIYNVNGS